MIPELSLTWKCNPQSPKPHLHPTLSDHCQAGAQLPPLDCTFYQSVRPRPLPSHFVHVPRVLLLAHPSSLHLSPQLPPQSLILPPASSPQKIRRGCRSNPSRVESKIEADAASLTIRDEEKRGHSAGGKQDRNSGLVPTCSSVVTLSWVQTLLSRPSRGGGVALEADLTWSQTLPLAKVLTDYFHSRAFSAPCPRPPGQPGTSGQPSPDHPAHPTPESDHCKVMHKSFCSNIGLQLELGVSVNQRLLYLPNHLQERRHPN